MDSSACERILPMKAYDAKPVPNSLSVQPCRFPTPVGDSVGDASECSVAVTDTVSEIDSRSDS